VEPAPRAAYDSPARSQQARATRRAIVAAAGELFLEQGFAATTIDAVAARAGVGRKTVFSSVGGKGALLKLVWDWALVGDDEPVPMSDRPAVRAMLAERDPLRLVRMWVDMLLDVGARAAPIGAVVMAAADVDPEVRALVATIHRESLAGATAFVTHLADAGGLRAGVAVEEGAEACWALVNSLLQQLLVAGRGWSREAYGDWLVELVSATLLPAPASSTDRPRSRVRVVDVPERGQYEALVEGRLAGRLTYERTKRVVVLVHTDVGPGVEDLRVADALVRRALDDVRSDGHTRVLAVCPFVTWWLGRHPDDASLLLATG
jgi:AcrR family transcriptional regulator